MKSPSALNGMFRLALIAKNHGSHFLNDAQSFDRMLGPGRFAEMNSETFRDVSGIVKTIAYRTADLGAKSAQSRKRLGKNGLQRKRFG